jgi:hypothetical protein
MNIPLEVVEKGKEAVNKYVELSEKKDNLYGLNSKSARNFFNQISDIYQAIEEFNSAYRHTGNPYYSIEKEKWIVPSFDKLSRITDEIWTKQKNMENSLLDYIEACHEYVKVSDEINKFVD